MRTELFWLLSFGGFAAMSLLCGILVWPQLVAAWPSIEEAIDRFRRLPPLAKLVLMLFVGAFVVYGSTKTNLVDQTSGTNMVEIVEGGTNDVDVVEGGTNDVIIVEGGTNDVGEIDFEGGTNEVEIADGDTTNTPPMMLMMAMPFFGDQPPAVTPEDIARGWQLWEVRTNCNISYTMPEDATLATNWWVRGAYEDVNPFDFGSWRFPFGSNSYKSAWAFSWGKVRFELGNTNTEIVVVGAPMSAVPYRSRLWSAADTNGAKVVTWENFALGRVPSADYQLPSTNYQLVSAQIELRTTGDFVTRSNEVETVYRRVDDFDWDGDGIPNWSDWDPYWYDGDYTGQEDWWREYVDECVGTGLENGYYKLTATFPQAGFRRTVLTVGWEEIVVAEPGEYVFLLEKGNYYDIGLEPFVDAAEFDAVDDIPPEGERLLPLMAGRGHWEGKWSKDDGRLYLDLPQMGASGCVMWTPKLCVSPDGWNPSTGDLSETFTAMLFDRTGWMEEPTYQWESANRSVTFGSPAAETTRATWRMGDFEAVSAHLTVSFGYRQLESTLGFTYHDENEGDWEDDDGFSFGMSGMPDTMFVNNDDDNDDGQEDFWSMSADDDWGFGRIELWSSVPTNGTIRIDNRDGFDGIIYDENCGQGNVGMGTEWEVNDDYGKEIDLSFNASERSECYEGSQIKVRWIPESGIEKTFVRRFTVVEPEAEPICSETIDVVEDGVSRKLTLNPCGVGIGHNAYFRIVVEPEDYPDSLIEWQAEGSGAVAFVGGNTGREVCVRGVSEGDLTLSVDIGGCTAAMPSFPLRVVDNVQVKLSVWIIANRSGQLARTPQEVREMVKEANDIFAQVGMSFYIDSITITNIPAAYRVIYRGDSTEQAWNFARVANIASGTGGLECYFIGEFLDAANVLAANDKSGMLLTSRANGTTLAHEIGHACGLKDIYWDKGPESVSMSETFEWRHAIHDWDGGSYGNQTVGSRYYHHNTKLHEIIDRLLMLGDRDAENDRARDISTGAVEGVYKYGDTDDESTRLNVRTGIFRDDKTTRHPVHQ